MNGNGGHITTFVLVSFFADFLTETMMRFASAEVILVAALSWLQGKKDGYAVQAVC